jgi:hypothetical protein
MFTGYYLINGPSGGVRASGHLEVGSDCVLRGKLQYVLTDRLDANMSRADFRRDWREATADSSQYLFSLIISGGNARFFDLRIEWHEDIEVMGSASGFFSPSIQSSKGWPLRYEK